MLSSSRLGVLALIAVSACKPPDLEPPATLGTELVPKGTDTAATTDTTDTGADTTDTGPPLVGLQGLNPAVVLIEARTGSSWQTFSAALFVADTQGIANLTSCLFLGRSCFNAYPAVGETTVPLVVDVEAIETFDAGEVMLNGDALSKNSADPSLLFYDGTSPFWAGSPGHLSYHGELTPYDGKNVINHPARMDVTAPDTQSAASLAGSGLLVFSWVPGAGNVHLRSATGSVTGLDDAAGTFSASAASMGLQAPFDSQLILLSRVNTQELSAAGNTVSVETRSEQPIQVDYEDYVGWTELVTSSDVADSCDTLGGIPPVPAGNYWGNTVGNSDSLTLPEGNIVLDGFTAFGNEVVLPINLMAGQQLSASTRTLPGADSSMYLLNASCDVDNPLAGSDTTLSGGVEEFTYTAPVNERVLLVVDRWYGYKTDTYKGVLEPGGLYALELDIQ